MEPDAGFRLEEGLDPDEVQRAEALLAQLEAWDGRACTRCEAVLCGHDLTVSWAMGFKQRPLCLACLAHGLDRPREEFREDVYERVTRRDCFRQGWLWASQREGYAADDRPPCLWPSGSAGSSAAVEPAAATEAHALEANADWDAGDMSCGDLVLALRWKLAELAPGGVLKLRAIDTAAPEDIPAWCRVTRNQLLREEHPHYWIQRKDA